MSTSFPNELKAISYSIYKNNEIQLYIKILLSDLFTVSLSLLITISYQLSLFSYLVTLKTRSKRTHLSTDIPKSGIILVDVRTVSVILPMTTKQSKRLNNDTK